jgi:hypothetical protein
VAVVVACRRCDLVVYVNMFSIKLYILYRNGTASVTGFWTSFGGRGKIGGFGERDERVVGVINTRTRTEMNSHPSLFLSLTTSRFPNHHINHHLW